MTGTMLVGMFGAVALGVVFMIMAQIDEGAGRYFSALLGVGFVFVGVFALAVSMGETANVGAMTGTGMVVGLNLVFRSV